MNSSENRLVANKPGVVEINKECWEISVADIMTFMQEYFLPGGAEQPCDLLKALASQYAESMKGQNVKDGIVVKTLLDTIELIAFISVLYSKFQDVQHRELQLSE